MFKNLRLSAKIGGGFTVVLLLTLCIGFVGWKGMWNVADRSSKANDMSQIVTHLYAMRLDLLYFMREHTDERVTSFRENLNRLLSVAGETREQYQQAANKLRVDGIRALAGDYEAAFNKYVELQRQKEKNLAGVVSSAATLEKTIHELASAMEAGIHGRSQIDAGLAASMMAAEEIHIEFLEARGVAKDYISSERAADAEKVHDRLEALAAHAEQLGKRLVGEQLSALGEVMTALASYRQGFTSYVEASQAQGVALAAMVEAAGKTIEQCEAFSAEQNARMEAEIASAHTMLLAGVAVALLLGGVFAVFITRVITSALGKGVDFAAEVAQGRLDTNLAIEQRDEIGKLADSLRDMVARLRGVVGEVVTASANVAGGSEELAASAEQISQGATEQAASIEEISSNTEEISASFEEISASIEEISANMEQMAANIAQNTENARVTEQTAVKSAESAIKGGQAVAKTVQAMKDIAQKISIIEEIARQTNLLALNAAIEAARAGEHGKGFAVVAAEVRKLAERSGTAAAEIRDLSGGSVAIAEEAGDMLSLMVPDIQRTADLVQEIAAASREQDAGAGQVNTAIQQLEKTTQQLNGTIQQFGEAIQQLEKVIQQNTSASEEMASTAEELSSQAEQLQASISFFRVDDNGNGNGSQPRRVAVRAAPAVAVPAGGTAPRRANGQAKRAKAFGGAKPAGMALRLGDDGDEEFERF